jgi:hypothetical protein
LLVASGAVLVLKPLPSIKIWYAFGVLSKRELFTDVDVGRILRIPINNQAFGDFIAWGEMHHGRYTVKLGYHLQWKHQFRAGA